MDEVGLNARQAANVIKGRMATGDAPEFPEEVDGSGRWHRMRCDRMPDDGDDALEIGRTKAIRSMKLRTMGPNSMREVLAIDAALLAWSSLR